MELCLSPTDSWELIYSCTVPYGNRELCERPRAILVNQEQMSFKYAEAYMLKMNERNSSVKEFLNLRLS